MKRAIFFVLMVIMVSVCGVFAGASGEKAAEGSANLTLWCAYSQPDRITSMDKAIGIYKSENPNVDVVRELVPWGNVRQRWIAGKMAKTLPQMVVASDSDLINMWEAGDLEPVNDIVQAMGGPGTFLEGPLSGLKVKDQYIGMPHYTLSWKMVVRTDWLAELGLSIPKTWDEFAKAAVAMTKAPERYGFDMPFSKSAYKAREWLAYFMRTNGADFFDANGKAHFNTPETIETVKFIVDLYKKTGRQAALNYSEDDCITNFAKGNLGFIFCAGSLVNAIRGTNPDLINKIAVIDTPINPKKNIPPRDGAGLVGIGKFKGVANSQETSKFMRFLLRQDIYRDFLLSMPNMVPITVEGSKDNLFWNNPIVADYTKLYQRWMEGAMTGTRVGMEHGPTPVSSAGMNSSEIEDMFHSILVDGVSVEAAVKATHDRIAAQLAAAGY
jgi:multiple sugar transport system substrate-binding protein